MRFALTHPGHFAVMFRTDIVNAEDEAFQEASRRAYDLLRGFASEALSPADELAPALAARSLVHGLATLLLSGVMRPDPGQSEGRPGASGHAVADGAIGMNRPAGSQ
ncbi:hypothetical protein GCM10022223_25980 [Kineosporia mesophila]|uniref:HTH-type transcriptional regulator MT1864/Rv1816-like C-terminal domain-containing protein n=1 Tax=Kineosporia mesophila TaxID=566012 RepID=A0ABP6ZGN7_9ACTN|nr:TetR-like C-terminal domain-containing protein [Kineosporia mesophila]MCD5350517.1 WHG domain-containing protein [Kineosporia mesophila]